MKPIFLHVYSLTFSIRLDKEDKTFVHLNFKRVRASLAVYLNFYIVWIMNSDI